MHPPIVVDIDGNKEIVGVDIGADVRQEGDVGKTVVEQ